MTQSPPTLPSSNESAERKSSLGWFDRAGRILLSLCIVAAVAYCIWIVQEIRSSDQRRSDSANDAPPMAAEEGLMGLLGGNWQFAGAPWQMSAVELTQSEATDRVHAALSDRDLQTRVAATVVEFANTLPPTAESLPGKSPDQAPELRSEQDDIVISFLQLLQPDVSDNELNRLYRVDRPDIQAIALAPLAAPEQIQVVCAALRLDDSRWYYLELHLQRGPTARKASGAVTLLPVPSQAKLATRCDSSGRIMAELVPWEDDLSSLAAIWSAEGWQVQSQLQTPQLQINDADLPLGSTESPRLAPTLAEDVLTCTRGAESRLVIVSQIAGALQRKTLLIVRAPE